MSAVLPAEQKLPRSNSKQYNQAKKIAQAVAQYQQTSSALRYQHLPDYDPKEMDWEIIENRLRERFAMMRLMTKRAIKGVARAVIVSGPGGVGKTHDIDKVLDEWDPEGTEYTTSSGYVRATGLYKLLWKHRHKGNLIKFDDSDSLFYDDTCLNLLKIACDTTKERVVSWRSEARLYDDNEELIPRSFEFKGTIIFVSNLDFDMMIDKGTKLAPHLEALITRSMYINMGMRTKYDYLVRLFMVAYPKDGDGPGLFEDKDMTPQEIDDTMKFIEMNYRLLRECSLRMGLKIGMLRQMAEEDDEISWDRQAIISCCRTGTQVLEPEPDEPDIVTVDDDDEEDEEVANGEEKELTAAE